MAPLTGCRPTLARVDLSTLQRNLLGLTTYAAGRAAAHGRAAPGVIAVVKANAYGHGAVRAALAFEAAGARMLACADIEEAVELREAGVRAPILVFGALEGAVLERIFSHALTPTVSSPAAATALARAAASRGVRLHCHLHVDTGMNRLGFRDDNLSRTLPPVLDNRHLAIDAVYTHFATADDTGHPLFDEQQARFARVRAGLAAQLPGAMWHTANSAAILRDDAAWYDLLRPGLALYGAGPRTLSAAAHLEPPLSLVSQVVALKGLRPGDAVGYGARFVAREARRMAVVPVGYADGIDVRMSGRAHVLVRGHRAPIIGSVCMDMIMIDVSGLPVEPGDEVVIIGRQGDEVVDVRDLAAAIGTIPYELLCRIGTRIARVYEGTLA